MSYTREAVSEKQASLTAKRARTQFSHITFPFLTLTRWLAIYLNILSSWYIAHTNEEKCTVFLAQNLCNHSCSELSSVEGIQPYDLASTEWTLPNIAFNFSTQPAA